MLRLVEVCREQPLFVLHILGPNSCCSPCGLHCFTGLCCASVTNGVSLNPFIHSPKGPLEQIHFVFSCIEF